MACKYYNDMITEEMYKDGYHWFDINYDLISNDGHIDYDCTIAIIAKSAEDATARFLASKSIDERSRIHICNKAVMR